jgi:hypothetical protein
MHPAQHKLQVIREAFRLLKPGGRYGIHELCLTPDDLDEASKRAIEHDLASVIHHGTRPLTSAEWGGLLEGEGFVVEKHDYALMSLLEPGRIIRDEGFFRALRFGINLLCNRAARQRVLAMRRVFATHRNHLGAIVLVGRKKETGSQ